MGGGGERFKKVKQKKGGGGSRTRTRNEGDMGWMVRLLLTLHWGRRWSATKRKHKNAAVQQKATKAGEGKGEMKEAEGGGNEGVASMSKTLTLCSGVVVLGGKLSKAKQFTRRKEGRGVSLA